MPTYDDIIAKINLANNGRLLLSCFTAEEKTVLDEMRRKNIVAPALFCGMPAVKVHSAYKGA